MKRYAEGHYAPSELSPEDRALLEQITEEVFQTERPALVGRNNARIELPEPVFAMLVKIVKALSEGRSLVLVPEDEPLTTQAAANYLGVSRPFLVKLLDEGKIPHHTVGTHRRVMFSDLKSFEHTRDAERRTAMRNLFKKIEDDGALEVAEGEEDAG